MGQTIFSFFKYKPNFIKVHYRLSKPNRHQPVARTRGPQLYAPLGALEARVHCYDPMNAQLLGLAFGWTVSGVVYVPILETAEDNKM